MNVELLKNLTILHVEDDGLIQFLVSSILKGMVKEIHLAANGREGLEMFRRHRPDLVLTDIRTPEMSGLDMVAAIREEDRDVPIIVATAFNEVDYLMRAIDLGVDRYVVKPVDKDMLIEVLAKSAEVLSNRRQVEEANLFNRFLIDINPNFIVVVNHGVIEYVNKTFLRFMGMESTGEFRSSGVKIWSFLHNIDGVQDEERLKNWLQHVVDNRDSDTVVTFKGRDGDVGSVFLASTQMFPKSDKFVVCFTDITRLEAEKRHLISKATTDHLTGVGNRLKFMDVFNDERERLSRYGDSLSLIMFDIDDFKQVNDTYGHDAGDRVLRSLARLVSVNIRKQDKLVRWGGEEFMVLSPECDAEQASGLAEKLRLIIEERDFAVDRRVTCSFGVTGIGAEEDLQDVLLRVDKALYEAKSLGKNRVVLRHGSSPVNDEEAV